MKTLVIQNNFPEFITQLGERVSIDFDSQRLVEENFNSEVALYNDLKYGIDDENYDLIIVSINLDKNNCLNFDGLDVVYTLRLSPDIKHQKVPIIILGSLGLEVVLRLCPKANILLSPGIHYKILTPDVLDFIQQNNFGNISDGEFKEFMQIIHLKPPENYASSHSLTNEWNIKRWFELIKNNESQAYKKLCLSIYNLIGLQTLHFKFVDEQNKILSHKLSRGKFKEKDKQEISIKGIENRKILFIDDEGHKGWNDLLCYIFENSNAELDKFLKFDKQDKSETLYNKLKAEYITSKAILNYDLLIIDLRLCDDDFNLDDLNKLTSFKFIEDIRSLNEGFQVMIFTASNKSWNIKRAIELGVTEYVVKESPMQMLSRQETYQKFVEFNNGVKKCIEKSFLSQMRTDIDQIKENNVFIKSKEIEKVEFSKLVFENGALLDELFTILKINHNILSNSALLICFTILESYADLFGSFDNGTWMIIDKNDEFALNYNRDSATTSFEIKRGFFTDIMKTTSEDDFALIGIDFYDSPKRRSIDSKVRANHPAAILRISTVLKYRDNISNSDINKLFKLVFIRNNSIAHNGNIKSGVKIGVDDIIWLINNIFKVIFKQKGVE